VHILITGAAGMIGRKLTERLVAGPLHGQAIERLTLTDVLATVSFYYGHRDPVSVTAG